MHPAAWLSMSPCLHVSFPLFSSLFSTTSLSTFKFSFFFLHIPPAPCFWGFFRLFFLLFLTALPSFLHSSSSSFIPSPSNTFSSQLWRINFVFRHLFKEDAAVIYLSLVLYIQARHHFLSSENFLLLRSSRALPITRCRWALSSFKLRRTYSAHARIGSFTLCFTHYLQISLFWTFNRV